MQLKKAPHEFVSLGALWISCIILFQVLPKWSCLRLARSKLSYVKRDLHFWGFDWHAALNKLTGTHELLSVAAGNNHRTWVSGTFSYFVPLNIWYSLVTLFLSRDDFFTNCVSKIIVSGFQAQCLPWSEKQEIITTKSARRIISCQLFDSY